MTHWGRKTQLDQYLDAKRDAQTLTVRCGLCSWSFVSVAVTAREQARAHRAAHHPELVARPRGHRRNSYHDRRDQTSPEDLAERETLRRTVRNDLPAVQEER